MTKEERRARLKALQKPNILQAKDGRCYEMRAGDLFYIGPGHDSWVVGDEPYVSLHFLGAEHYAKH
jgi:hypothetical protein